MTLLSENLPCLEIDPGLAGLAASMKLGMLRKNGVGEHVPKRHIQLGLLGYTQRPRQ